MVAFQKIYLFLKDEINVYNQDKKNSLKLMQRQWDTSSTEFALIQQLLQTLVTIELTNNFICLNEQKRLEDIDAIITVSQVPDHFLPSFMSIQLFMAN